MYCYHFTERNKYKGNNMEIKTITCPACGGRLDITDPSRSMIYCQFCGNAVQIETARTKGHDIEYGRRDARAEMADKVLPKLLEMKESLIDNGDARYALDVLPGLIEERKQQIRHEMTHGWVNVILGAVGSTFLSLFVSLIIVGLASKVIIELFNTSARFDIGDFVILFMCVAGIAVSFYIGFRYLNIRKLKVLKNLRNDKTDKEELLETARKTYEETEKYINSVKEIDLAPSFRTEEAVNFIIAALKSRQCVDLKEACFKYNQQRGNLAAMEDI